MSTVYFLSSRSRNPGTNSLAKLTKLLDTLMQENPALIQRGDLTAIKVHFGEIGNEGYISPVLAKSAALAVQKAGALPFFTDTNTLYKGSRSNAVDHLTTASAHGYLMEVCGAPVIIADGLKSKDWREVPLSESCKHFKTAKIASGILDADSMVVLSHVKGHEMAGFGGAIKNLAMGCAPYIGKREQHCVTFHVKSGKCIKCGRCIGVCPVNAISFNSEDKAYINPDRCIGCGECISFCPVKAISMNWQVGLTEFTEKMTEYALGALSGKTGRVLFINIVRAIVPGCDCLPWSDTPIVPDIGFLASTDPVAIDQAAFDLIKGAESIPGSALDGKAQKGQDKFTALYPESKPELQLEHGEQIGLGSRTYELVTL
ncbi:MAG TPA: DUF362 domain-containing protein [Spirochaetia bacterium]|nr:DUF362 domain-containing protein [Spirochaetales bacterium]HPD79792.1 DUF362 domain-containing protein [Spirochaetales bacterium]HRS65350.1 DUF362 domain-containing protein [Spirochaetia bacterium]HRV29922.1 DUF362 domain-containing protein [Spirochaetia bacterium]